MGEVCVCRGRGGGGRYCIALQRETLKFDLHDNCVTVNAVHDCACCGWLSLLESYHTSRYSQHDVRQKVLLLLWLLYDSTLHHQTLYDSTLHHQTLLYIYVWSSFVPLLYFFWLLVFTLSIGHGQSLCTLRCTSSVLCINPFIPTVHNWLCESTLAE